ncbi:MULTISPECIES: DUF5670 family protein [Clostridium]|jgi:hypothetical protein|uniref:Lmo0937 family membrane protein n=2 Tax=Clostridium TaxID=1485 RepID=A0A151ANB3_9CLOT|nr:MULTISPECIES: DUF5670 family protein [Clostridium]KYH29113.1 hypothetical protein CLCOL_12500 [Clostridium colicanis DSM 13634]PRR72421.1 hypothetical protein CPAL_14950 [Clostridium thermopalmarium DSM 5974]PVZ20875.1 hypothetical protein LX19_02564 [Clostridium thermopalmarium DSM 5974]
MSIFNWIGGFILIIWLLAILFKIGNALIHDLLILAFIIFIIGLLYDENKSK